MTTAPCFFSEWVDTWSSQKNTFVSWHHHWQWQSSMSATTITLHWIFTMHKSNTNSHPLLIGMVAKAQKSQSSCPFAKFWLSPGRTEQEMVEMCNAFLQIAPEHCQCLKKWRKGQTNHEHTCFSSFQQEENVDVITTRMSVACCRVLHFGLPKTWWTETAMEWM